MGTITTTLDPVALGSGSQRKIDRCSNGVLHSMFTIDTGVTRSSLSADAGGSWSAAEARGSWINPSIWVSPEDDAIHVTYKDYTQGDIRYVRATPTNAARTAYSWSSPIVVYTGGSGNYNPDLVVHPDLVNSGAFFAHIFWCFQSGSSFYTAYKRVAVAANGTFTLSSANNDYGALLNGTAANEITYPSADLRHNGNGKTIAVVGGNPQPDIFIGWSSGNTTGTGGGLRFRKLSYTGPNAWTLGAEVLIDPNKTSSASSVYFSNCMFDGSRVVITTNAGGGFYAWDRDVADTTTTARVAEAWTTAASQMYGGNTTYNSLGDIFFFGKEQSSAQVKYRRWVRATGTLEPTVVIDDTNIRADNGTNGITARRGPAGMAIDYLYLDGAGSPFTITSGRINLNAKPTKPTISAPAANAVFDRAQPQTFTAVSTDAEGDQMLPTLRYRLAGSSDSWTTVIGTLGNLSIVVARNTFAPAGYEAQMSVTDPNGSNTASDWSDVFYFAARDNIPTRARSRTSKAGVGVLSTTAQLGSASQAASKTGSLNQRLKSLASLPANPGAVNDTVNHAYQVFTHGDGYSSQYYGGIWQVVTSLASVPYDFLVLHIYLYQGTAGGNVDFTLGTGAAGAEQQFARYMATAGNQQDGNTIDLTNCPLLLKAGERISYKTTTGMGNSASFQLLGTRGVGA